MHLTSHTLQSGGVPLGGQSRSSAAGRLKPQYRATAAVVRTKGTSTFSADAAGWSPPGHSILEWSSRAAAATNMQMKQNPKTLSFTLASRVECPWAVKTAVMQPGGSSFKLENAEPNPNTFVSSFSVVERLRAINFAVVQSGRQQPHTS